MLGPNASVSPLTDKVKLEAEESIANFASESMRTICMAYRDLPGNGKSSVTYFFFFVGCL
jgi:hypothetical protein